MHGDVTRPVQDHAERAFVAVIDDEHDGPPEVGVDHRGGGDQERSRFNLGVRWHATYDPTPGLVNYFGSGTIAPAASFETVVGALRVPRAH
ncbi:hypothetical protein Amsp01_024000 [Amycolatopsis sp. NBRC 101858]|nr:hypothetical protein Amsp01_024000 [Amycolatopsis sp. NBRC 101858]